MNPSKGHVIAWKRIYVPNHNKCKRARFSWTPTGRAASTDSNHRIK